MKIIKSRFAAHDIEELVETWLTEYPVLDELKKVTIKSKSLFTNCVDFFMLLSLFIIMLCVIQNQEPQFRERFILVNFLVVMAVTISLLYYLISIIKYKKKSRKVHENIINDEYLSQITTLLLCYKEYKKILSISEEMLLNAKLCKKNADEMLVIFDERKNKKKQAYQVWLPKHLNLVYEKKGVLDFSKLDEEYDMLVKKSKINNF